MRIPSWIFGIHCNCLWQPFSLRNPPISGSIWSRLRCSQNIAPQGITPMRRRPTWKTQSSPRASIVTKRKAFAVRCARSSRNMAAKSPTHWRNYALCRELAARRRIWFWATLFTKYRTARDYADPRKADLENAIKSTGFYRNKTKSIRGAMRAIVEKHGGKVPDTMEELCALPGVGRKTANVVLGNAFHKNDGIVVDTHVIRLSQRLGLTKHKDPEKIERDLMKLVPREHWTDWSHWLIWHGRRRCYARKPDCSNCEVFRLCPSGKVFLRTGAAKKPDAKPA